MWLTFSNISSLGSYVRTDGVRLDCRHESLDRAKRLYEALRISAVHHRA
jgi:hypothetical protein